MGFRQFEKGKGSGEKRRGAERKRKRKRERQRKEKERETETESGGDLSMRRTDAGRSCRREGGADLR